jgi:hypothetical protein
MEWIERRDPKWQERDAANLLGANAGEELYGRCPDCKTARRFVIAPPEMPRVRPAPA